MQFSCFLQQFLETILVCSVTPESSALRFARGRALELILYQYANSFLFQIAVEKALTVSTQCRASNEMPSSY